MSLKKPGDILNLKEVDCGIKHSRMREYLVQTITKTITKTITI